MDIIDAALAESDDFIARGHAIITRNLATAERLASEYPAVAALLPAIRSALQELFDHLVSVPTLPHQDAVDTSKLDLGPGTIVPVDLGPMVGGPAQPAPAAAMGDTAADPLIDTTDHTGT